MKNKSYIWISLVILVFGIWFIPRIVRRITDDKVVQGDRINVVDRNGPIDSDMAVIAKAPAFSFTNQDGKTVSNADYKDKVYVLEFFFTTCPTICPKMNENMKTLAAAFEGRKDFGIASISINPEYDTPKVLKEHRDALGIRMENWHFLTGKKETIYDLANKGFKVYVGQNNQSEGGFEHQGFFVLVDKKGNIRSRKIEGNNNLVYYDGVNPDQVVWLKHDIKSLLAE